MYALVEFLREGGAMEVVDVKNIRNFVLENAKRYDEVIVRWVNKAKPGKVEELCSARLLQIGSNRIDLVETLEKIIQDDTLSVLDGTPFIVEEKPSSNSKKRIRRFPSWRTAETETLPKLNSKATHNNKRIKPDIQRKADNARSVEILQLSSDIQNNSMTGNFKYACGVHASSQKNDGQINVKASKVPTQRKIYPDPLDDEMDDESSLDDDILSRRDSNNLLKAELAFEKKKRIQAEKDLANLKESMNLVQELRFVLSTAKRIVVTSANESEKNVKESDKSVKESDKSVKESEKFVKESIKTNVALSHKSLPCISAPLQNRASNSVHESVQKPTLHSARFDKNQDNSNTEELEFIDGNTENTILLEHTSSLHLPQDVVNQLCQKNYSRYSADLLLAVFGRRMLQTHVLRKQVNSLKPVLDQTKINQIIEHVRFKIDTEVPLIRAALRNKMCNVKEKKPKVGVST